MGQTVQNLEPIHVLVSFVLNYALMILILCIVGRFSLWRKAMAIVRLTYHVPKQSKTNGWFFSDLLILGNEDLNLTGFDGLNFPPKNFHTAYALQKFLKKKSLMFSWCSG